MIFIWMNILRNPCLYFQSNSFRYLERDISAENLVDIKQKVQDKYRYYYGGHQTEKERVLLHAR